MADEGAAERVADSLSELREVVEQRESELTDAKKRLQELQEEEKNAKKKQFEKRALEAKEQIANARGDRSRVREEIAEAYREQAEQERRSNAISEQLWHTQLERVTEEVLFKKMRYEKAVAKRSKLYSEQRDKEQELSTLDEELSRRDVNSEKMLQDALQRADVLRQALKELEEDGIDLHQKWLQSYRAKEDSNDNRKDFSLVDELMAQRHQRQRKKARDAAARLRYLNDERLKLSNQRREAIQRRKELEMLSAKGRDFMAEIELGEGPPIDFVKLNLLHQRASEEGEEEDDELQQEADAGDEDLDAMVGRLKESMDKVSQEVAALRREVDVAPPPDKLPDAPAATFLRDLNLPPSHPKASVPGNRLHWTIPPRTIETTTEARDCASAVIDHLVETAWRQLYIFVPQPDSVAREKQWWQTQGKSLEKEIKQRQLANTAWLVLDDLIEEVVAATVADIDKDIDALAGLSRQSGDDILLSSIRGVCQSIDNTRVVGAYKELVQTDAASERKHSMTVTWWAPPEGPAMPRPRKPVLKPWDLDARKLAHDHDNANDTESRWERTLRGFTSERCGVIAKQISGKVAITCMQLNAYGNLICIGRANGEILVFSCPSKSAQGQVEPVLLRKHSPVSSADGDLIIEIGWSFDSTQLYTINLKGLVVLWSMQVNPDSKGSKVSKLWRVAHLDESALQAPRTELELTQNDTVPSTACLHPSLTLMGSQPSIVLGTGGGDVVKCTAAQGAGGKLVVSEDLSVDCGENLNSVASAGNDKRDKSGSRLRPHYTVKETFSAHKSRVIAVEFGPSDTMITLDSTGKVLRWPYRRDHFTGFGWFRPDRSCQLGLDHSFSPIGEQQNIFPATGSSVSMNPVLNPRYLQEVNAASKAVANLKDLAVAPSSHKITVTGTLELQYPPKDIAGSFVDCTVLEYGVSGAGAGLLLRHASQRCEVSAASRGAIAPKSRSHLSFSSCRRKLYFLVSEETATGSTLIIVGLHTDRMSWLPIRVDAGTAQPGTVPVLCVNSVAGLRASNFAYVLNGGAIGMFCLQSGKKLQTVDDGGWGSMAVAAAGTKLALSRSSGPPEVWFLELKSESLQAAEDVIALLVSKAVQA